MRRVTFLASALFVAGYSGCVLSAQSRHESFSSPEEASAALFTAVRDQDEPALARILGAGSELLSSGDASKDKVDQALFVQKYQQMHRLARETHGERLLYIGAENWPFPVPLAEHNGAWRFDADAGRQEIRYRRVGEDEVTAIALCHTLLAAAKSGAAGATDGLTGEVLAAARHDRKIAFHGYTFRMFRTPNGPGFVAYPADYGNSGVMTFVIGPDDAVHQKALGANTAGFANTITAVQVDGTWTAAESTAP